MPCGIRYVFFPWTLQTHAHDEQNGVPAEFSVTCAEWLSTNNYQALPVLFVQAMVAFGYGDYREIPIVGQTK